MPLDHPEVAPIVQESYGDLRNGIIDVPVSYHGQHTELLHCNLVLKKGTNIEVFGKSTNSNKVFVSREPVEKHIFQGTRLGSDLGMSF